MLSALMGERTAAIPQSEAFPTEMKTIQGMQCGHVYCRMDNFGEYQGQDEAQLRGVDCTADLWNLLGKQDACTAHHRRVRTVAAVKLRPSLAATLQLPEPFPRTSGSAGSSASPAPSPRTPSGCSEAHDDRRLSVKHTYEMWHARRVVRVRSQPCLHRDEESDPTIAELKWVQASLRVPVGIELSNPPTVPALRLLLETFHPIYIHLYGRGSFKSFRELFSELTEHRTGGLVRHHAGLHLVIQRMMLKIRWKGHYLVCDTGQVRRPSLLADHSTSRVIKMAGSGAATKEGMVVFPSLTLRQEETWQVQATRWVYRHFALPSNSFKESLHGDITHSVQEKIVPPRDYPGLGTLERTYIVNWEVRGKAAQHFQRYDFLRGGDQQQEKGVTHATARLLNFPVSPTSPRPRDKDTYKFFTMPLSTGAANTGFPEKEDHLMRWNWMHHTKATGKQLWMLLDEQYPTVLFSEMPEAEVWARSVAKKEGVLPVPPSQEALLRLLSLFLSQEAVQQRMSLKEFWMELLLQQSHLVVERGRIFNVVEHVVIKMRGRHKQGWVNLCQSSHEKLAEDWMLPTQRKWKDETWRQSIQRWFDGYFGKVDTSSLTMEYGYFAEDCRKDIERSSMPTLHKWHLVTVVLKDEVLKTPMFGAWALTEDLVPGPRAPSDVRDFRWCFDEELVTTSSDGTRREQVHGASHFHREGAHRKSSVSSILLGLESSGPNQKGAFNKRHSVVGASGKVSATGSRKWRAYRVSGALEVPSEYGSMRLNVNRGSFKEFMAICNKMQLRDPIEDLAADQQKLDRQSAYRFNMEKEFFKLLLSSNGQEAREAFDSIVYERSTSKGREWLL